MKIFFRKTQKKEVLKLVLPDWEGAMYFKKICLWNSVPLGTTEFNNRYFWNEDQHLRQKVIIAKVHISKSSKFGIWKIQHQWSFCNGPKFAEWIWPWILKCWSLMTKVRVTMGSEVWSMDLNMLDVNLPLTLKVEMMKIKVKDNGCSR